MIVIGNNGTYSRATNAVFYHNFLGFDENYNEFEFDRFKNFYSLSELQLFIKTCIENFSNIGGDDSIEKYEYLKNKDESR